MKFASLSLRQVAIGVPIFGVLNWAILQFAILPKMTEAQRMRLYAGWSSTPYPLLINTAFICFAVWFVFSYTYKGSLATPGRKIAVFAMALGSLCGMLVSLAIRVVWRI